MERKEWLSTLKRHVSRFMTKRNQCIIFAFTIVVVAAAIYAAGTASFSQPVSVTLYAFAAVGFTCSCILGVKAVRYFVSVILVPFTEKNRIAHTLIKDTRLRTVLVTVPGMGFNLVYAVFYGVIGITHHSAWCGSLAAYYILLGIMRFLSVSCARTIYDGKYHPSKRAGYKKGNDVEKREYSVHRNCGIMLSISSIALGGAVIMLVTGEGGKSYPGLMIYAVATYTFYKLFMAVRNMIIAGKEKSILLITLRNIGYADALVSLLSLQTALFAAFGQDSGDMIPVTNALTGAGVCLMIFFMGIYMTRKSANINRRED